MKKLNDYKKAKYLLDDKVVEEVYPLSIVGGNQSGDIFVDDIEHPTFALFWHYCGFAFIVGECTTNIKEEICDSLNTLKAKHHNRMLIHMANDYELFEEDNIIRGERYIFSFDNQCKRLMVPSDCHICEINNENFDLVRGNIVPSFSWINKEEFLKKGFGFCLTKGQAVLACAFSAGVSEKIVDIGIETNEKHRGKGYAKIVASAMVDEILKQGKTPAWACDITNEGSKRLACSLGFRVEGTHPYYKIV